MQMVVETQISYFNLALNGKTGQTLQREELKVKNESNLKKNLKCRCFSLNLFTSTDL